MLPEVSLNTQEQSEYDWIFWLCLYKSLALEAAEGGSRYDTIFHGEFGGQNETMWFWAKRGLTGKVEKGQWTVWQFQKSR